MYFSSSSYACVKNPKKFWFLKWFGFHDFEISKISYWAFEKWEVYVRCTHCGITDRTFGVTEGELAIIRMDVSEEVMESHGHLLLRKATNE